MKPKFIRKVYKSKLSLLTAIALSTYSTSSFSNYNSSPHSSPAQITVCQIVQHPALDSSREGLIETLKASKIPIKIVFENANGQIATALQIAQKAVGNHSDVIVTLGTGATQAAQRATLASRTPIVFVSVTDPVGAKLVQSMRKPGGNITGVTNRYPTENQLRLFKRVQPNLQTIGTIYNPSEANSVTLLADLKQAAKKLGIKVEARVATKSGEVKAAAESLIGNCNAIYIFDDNTALSAFSSIALVCNGHELPLYASNPEFVEQGALLSEGADQEHLGKQAGGYVLDILKGSKPKDMPVNGPDYLSTVINATVAKRLGITIPKDLLKRAKIIK